MINIALLDDHDVVSGSLAIYLDDHSHINVVFQATNIQAMSNWLEHNSVDVIITDLSLRGESGFSFIEMLNASDNQAKVLVLTMHESEPYISKALAHDVHGYITKSCSPDELVFAIEHVYSGNVFISKNIALKVNHSTYQEQLGVIESLTERERQVFDLLSKGTQIKHIAQKLNIATKTAHVHRTNVMKKLKKNHDFELTKYALALGFLDINLLTE